VSDGLGSVALVTGGSSGIGLAVATALGAKGLQVLLTGRDSTRLEAAAERVRAGGGTAPWYAADLGRDEDLRSLATWVERESGRLDLLVHSAGSLHLGSIDSVGWQDLDADYRINVRAPFLLTKALLPLLRTARGQLVFVNSTAGLAAGPDNALYAATKHALRSLAGSIRDQVNASGIRVLSVFPGRTATPMQEAVVRFERRSYRPDELLQPEDVAEMVVSALLLPRTAEVVDVVIRPMTKPTAERSPP
jgi:NADP-dependent 3-hydroxy acid dehydrogenase YdfG